MVYGDCVADFDCHMGDFAANFWKKLIKNTIQSVFPEAKIGFTPGFRRAKID